MTRSTNLHRAARERTTRALLNVMQPVSDGVAANVTFMMSELGEALEVVVGPASAISRRLPADFHPFIGNVVAMAVATTATVSALGLLPGW